MLDDCIAKNHGLENDVNMSSVGLYDLCFCDTRGR